jgi:diguanylate cyclase (GGDEF)-like protein
MLHVLQSTLREHQSWLLILSAMIWCIGSICLFLLLQRSRELTIRRRRQWSVIGAVSGGTAVWATHFVAMLGHKHQMDVRFDVLLTAVSIAEVIALLWAALLIVVDSMDVRRCVGAGLVATLGVALMHFTGMAAMVSMGHCRYAVEPIVIAALIAAGCFCAAFLTFARLKGVLQVLLPAMLAMVAVLVLHFTAMSATTMVAGPADTMRAAGLDTTMLASIIVFAAVTIVFLTGAAVFLDRLLTDMRGIADATQDGLVIIHSGRIVEVNGRFATMAGVDAAALVGTSPDRWLSAADGLSTAEARTSTVEACLVGDGEPARSLELAAYPIEFRGRACSVLSIRDLSEKKAAQERIEHMARHDALTDLPNRSLFDERLAHGIARGARDGQAVAVLAIDLDRFKAVNDIFGHAAGDQILRRVADLLKGTVRATDTVARIGGDEFLVLQVGAAQPEGAHVLAQRILAEFAREMDTTRDPTAVGASIGVAIYPNDADTAEGLRYSADIALYRAKAAGRGTACFFDRDMDSAVKERRALEQDLRTAISYGQMHVAYQPLVHTESAEISGYEALLRWTHPERGEVPPDVFVPVAEESGAIVALGEWIMREACRAAVRWDDHLILAVNVSAIQFQVPNLVETVAAILRETGLSPHRLELEITESVLMKDRASALATLRRIKSLGVGIVMDDFGTGYSSLSNLQNFPFDKIKIDRSFVAAIEDDAAARSIIRAIVSIGRSLDLAVVAEGVETAAQHRMVLEEGCPQAQGYLFGMPSSAIVDSRINRRIA